MRPPRHALCLVLAWLPRQMALIVVIVYVVATYSVGFIAVALLSSVSIRTVQFAVVAAVPVAMVCLEWYNAKSAVAKVRRGAGVPLPVLRGGRSPQRVVLATAARRVAGVVLGRLYEPRAGGGGVDHVPCVRGKPPLPSAPPATRAPLLLHPLPVVGLTRCALSCFG